MTSALRVFLAALVCLGAQAAAQLSPLVTVPTLDVPRYMGTWYEIAKYPNRFQKACIADTRAEYRLVAVSEPKREFLWVLSCSPQVDPAAYDALTGRLAAQGFELRKLEKTAQTPAR